MIQSKTFILLGEHLRIFCAANVKFNDQHDLRNLLPNYHYQMVLRSVDPNQKNYLPNNYHNHRDLLLILKYDCGQSVSDSGKFWWFLFLFSCSNVFFCGVLLVRGGSFYLFFFFSFAGSFKGYLFLSCNFPFLSNNTFFSLKKVGTQNMICRTLSGNPNKGSTEHLPSHPSRIWSKRWRNSNYGCWSTHVRTRSHVPSRGIE